MEKSKHSCIVIIPVGPRTELRFLRDTLESAFQFCDPLAKIIVIDNTAQGLRAGDIPRAEQMDIIRCENGTATNSVSGRLYYNVSKALRHARDRYEFETVLRLDDDALVIGTGAEREAVQFFRQHPDVGCLGSYRVMCNGERRNFTAPRQTLRSEVSLKGALRHPQRWKCLRYLHALARRNGYEDGAHCLGAAVFLSRACVERFAAADFLERDELLTSKLCDDHIIGMMVMAAGFKIEDFATEGKPLGLAWKGLPASPADLIAMEKKIVHSVKSFGELDQTEVRAEFRRLLPPRRYATAAASRGTVAWR